jgi:hypothetical protein
MAIKKNSVVKTKKINPKNINEKSKSYFFNFVESKPFNIVLLILASLCVFSSLIYSFWSYLGKIGDFGISFYLLVPSLIFLMYFFKFKLNSFWSKLTQHTVNLVIGLLLLFVFFTVFENILCCSGSFDLITLILGLILIIILLFILLYLILSLFKKQKVINDLQLFNIVFFFSLFALLVIILYPFFLNMSLFF